MITVTTRTGSHALDKGILSCPVAPFEQVSVNAGHCSACGDALTVPDMAAVWAVVAKHNLTFRELDVLGVPTELRDNLVAYVSGLPVSNAVHDYVPGDGTHQMETDPTCGECGMGKRSSAHR